MPGCIRRVREIYREAGGNIPIQHSIGNYFWPDSPDVPARNAFQFFHPAGGEVKEVDSASFLLSMAHGHLNYIDGPMVYHNFVPMELLRRLTHGLVFFRRAGPDIYSSLAVAANTQRFISTQELLTISGQGAKSTGASVQRGGADQWMSEMEAQYAPRYASRYASRTIQFQSLDCLIEVAEHFERPDLLAEICWARHIARSISEAVKRMPQPVRKREVREAIALAYKQGVMARVGILIVGRKLETMLRLVRGRRSGPQAFAQGQVITFDPDQVRNVFDATLAVHRILNEARYTESSKLGVFAPSH
jgi:hypothetical protein